MYTKYTKCFPFFFTLVSILFFLPQSHNNNTAATKCSVTAGEPPGKNEFKSSWPVPKNVPLHSKTLNRDCDSDLRMLTPGSPGGMRAASAGRAWSSWMGGWVLGLGEADCGVLKYVKQHMGFVACTHNLAVVV